MTELRFFILLSGEFRFFLELLVQVLLVSMEAQLVDYITLGLGLVSCWGHFVVLWTFWGLYSDAKWWVYIAFVAVWCSFVCVVSDGNFGLCRGYTYLRHVG